MLYYKDTENKVHFLDSSDFAYLLPEGSVDITDEEAAALQNPAKTTAQLADDARAKRDALLASTVDTVNAIRWAAMSAEEQAAWAAYRQALLDVPEQAGFPAEIVWPEAPQ